MIARKDPIRRWQFPAAAAAAALLLLAMAGGSWLRASRSSAAGAAAERISSELVRQLADPAHEPDFSRLGDALPVTWERFGDLERDVRFTPLTPATLPGGYAFDGAWLISTKACRMVCARYRKGDRVVALVQGPSSGAAPVCTLANPRCCMIGGMVCRLSQIDRMDVLQTTRGRVAVTLAARTGETDMNAVIASLGPVHAARED